MSSTITIAGREYRPVVETTIEHDVWIGKRMRMAGIDRMEKSAVESVEEFALRVVLNLMESGEFLELLGGWLVPADVDPDSWTPALALQTASTFRRVKSPEDKQELIRVTGEMLALFLEAGIAFVRTSPKSSADAEDRPNQTKDQPTSGSGPNLSASSPATTRAATRSLSGGHSGKRSWRFWPFFGRQPRNNTN